MIATKSIALFGGSFDPIHNGHLFVIEELLSSARFEKFIVIPAGNPWQKSVAVSAAHRLAMVEIALKVVAKSFNLYPELKGIEDVYIANEIVKLTDRTLPITVTARNINQEFYWEDKCKLNPLMKNIKKEQHGNSYK